MSLARGTTRVDHINVSAYLIPTEFPESDGTYAWDSTTLVVVELAAAGHTGLGYTYADVAEVIQRAINSGP